MKRLPYAVICTTIFFTYAQTALAHGSGSAGGAPHFSGPAVGSHAAANSNGRFSSDRDHGRDRAEDRRGAKGKSHGKAAEAAKQRHRTHRDAALPAVNARAGSEAK